MSSGKVFNPLDGEASAILTAYENGTLGGGTPSGPAGGGLSGTYPSPTVGSGVITDANVAAGAAISPTKIALVNDGPWSTPTQRSNSQTSWRRRATNGTYYGPLGSLRGDNITVTAGYEYWCPVFIERPVTIGNLAVTVQTPLPTGGHVRIGLYADSGTGVSTGAPLADSGLIALPTTGGPGQIVAAAVNYAVATPGLYHLGVLACNDITGSLTLLGYSPTSYFAAAFYTTSLTTALSTNAPAGAVGAVTWPYVIYTVTSVT